jgi:hypothetical protein
MLLLYCAILFARGANSTGTPFTLVEKVTAFDEVRADANTRSDEFGAAVETGTSRWGLLLTTPWE